MASVITVVTTPRTIQVEGSNPSSLPDDLNAFYTRFETDNITQLEESRSSLKPGSSALTFKTEDVVRTLRRTRERSLPGPDNISRRVLRHCAGQLGNMFRTLFQHSTGSHTVPQLWKHSTVIPIPKRSNPKSLNDLRPVALTSLVMKAMEKIIKQPLSVCPRAAVATV